MLLCCHFLLLQTNASMDFVDPTLAKFLSLSKLKLKISIRDCWELWLEHCSMSSLGTDVGWKECENMLICIRHHKLCILCTEAINWIFGFILWFLHVFPLSPDPWLGTYQLLCLSTVMFALSRSVAVRITCFTPSWPISSVASDGGVAGHWAERRAV